VLGLGLASALRAALHEAELDIADAACRLSDLTGEKYFFLEANYALGRLLRRRKPEFPLWHPMDSIGDSGAAAGFCLLAIAMAALTQGYAPGPILLCQMSAESGRRAAVIVRGNG
jgi:3-oxoacyl-[acyl-carrier-protein] synthase-1